MFRHPHASAYPGAHFIVEPVTKIGVQIRAARLIARALVGSDFYASHGFTALLGS
jgi:hypothetical protein